jgi:hypothetical protein
MADVIVVVPGILGAVLTIDSEEIWAFPPRRCWIIFSALAEISIV